MLGFINVIITVLILIILSFFFGKSTALAQEQIGVPPNAETPALESAINVGTLTLENAINLALNSNRPLQNAEIETYKAIDRTAAYRTRSF